LMVGCDCKMIDPATPSIPSAHDNPNDLATIFSD